MAVSSFEMVDTLGLGAFWDEAKAYIDDKISSVANQTGGGYRIAI